MKTEITKQLIDFLNASPSTFHGIDQMKKMLMERGYHQLQEQVPYELNCGGNYFVTRNDTSLIAFTMPHKKEETYFKIVASHSDSPTYKVKENSTIQKNGYLQLNCEGYGGMIASSWMDRPLSIAGRVVFKHEHRIVSKLLNVDKNLLMIPNVAIHINRDVNKGVALNAQIDMLPLLGSTKTYEELLASQLGIDKQHILSSDMYLYNRMPATFWGDQDDYIASSKLDNLESAFTTLKGFLNQDHTSGISVFACFDNEEVGSQTKQGAASTFLVDTLKRIYLNVSKGEQAFYCALAQSFMISCDNAHALHPNHPEKMDQDNSPKMNQGVVIKYNANQKYTTDAISAAMFKDICHKAKVPFQVYANRSDMPGGSTLGNIASSHVSIASVDIGLAQLAMHSSFESAGSRDVEYLYQAIKTFYSSSIQYSSESSIEVCF